tara:strand:+ start:13425 stop:14234 length:810 start_codon:yes stop_codon:yes gene_type:complete
MKKKRLIPVVLLRNGWIVQSKGFHEYQNLGNPVSTIQRLSEWASDEIIFLDISTSDQYDMRRDDQGYNNRENFIDILKDISSATFMPLTVGGKIRTMNDIEERLLNGADKICLNTMAFTNPNFITEAANEFGSQCIVVSLDAKKLNDGHYIFGNSGKDNTKLTACDLSKIVEEKGAGEIFINSIDNDGVGKGYDIDLIDDVSSSVNIPVIACGGVGEWDHFSDALDKTNVDAVAAANIFHYIDQSVFIAKKYLHDAGYNFRRPDLIKIK